jgi:hypothetical protein
MTRWMNLRGADGALRVSRAALVVALAVFGTIVVEAIRVGPVEAAPAGAPISEAALRFADAGPTVNIAAANARDPFADDRQAPAKRYRMPGEASTAPAPAAPRPVVLGTAIAPGGTSFAMCQVGPTDVVKVRVGGRVGEYTVVAIARGKVTFRAGDGEQFTVEASKP